MMTTGLYGNTTVFGGTYFEWFVFQQSATAPATPSGGSWDFQENTGIAPTGWTTAPPTAPTNTVWASIAIVNSRLSTPLVWTAPAPWVQQGVPGSAATIAVGTTTTLSPGSPATVANSGTSSAAVFNFGVPQGATGATGSPGTAATIAAGTTTTGAPGTSADVVNAGTSNAAIFNFTIPRGDVGPTGPTGATGATGATGTAATIAAGTTSTGAPGTSASVTNVGTSSAAVFDFAIPRGDVGPTGPTGAAGIPGVNWLGTWSGATTYAIRDAVAYLGSSYYAIASSTNQAPPNASFWNLLAEKGANGTGAGSVTSVDVSGGTTGLTTSGGPVTSAGTITLAGTLAVTNGGTGVTTSTGTGANVLSTTPTLTTPVQASYEDWTGIAAPAYSEGRVWYDSAAHALTYFNDSATDPVHIGQDLQIKVINNTGSTIANGSPVYITGTSSGQTYPNVALARADVPATSSVIGLTNGAIANGAIGYVTSQGGIDNVNTGTFTVGQVLYLSPFSAGQLMNTVPPTGITVQVGVVSFVNSSTGRIYVRQTTPLNVPASIISGTVAVANGGTGATSFAAAGIATLTGTETLTNKTVEFVDGTAAAPSITNVGDNNTGIFFPDADTIAFAEGGVEAARFDASGNLGIGTSSPTSKLDLVGILQWQAAAGTVLGRLTYAGGEPTILANTGLGLRFFTNNTQTAILDSSGNLGIGTASPVAKFDLVGDYKEGVVTANTGTTYTISTATGTLQILTLTGNCTFTFPTATTGESFTLFLRQDATGSRTATWPANVRWPGGTAPTITSTALRQDKYVFTADGTNWYGSNAGQSYTV
jgi:hypothetical protein